jgi:glycosyltransferase involved in cell wall biosynthesis
MSVSRQTFRDFEVIIVDCGSQDNTRQEIERFFNSCDYKNNPFKYQYVILDYFPQTVEDWNEPVLLATGKYIAMLEGDDRFLENHLGVAYDYLSAHENVGVYAAGNQFRKRFSLGLIQPEKWIDELFLMREIPPPSEAIFIRLNKSGTPFLYNVVDYEYAPEIDLYFQIALDNFCAYYSGTQLVWRDKSIPPPKNITWHYFVDCYTVMKKYKQLVTRNVYIAARYNVTVRVIEASLTSPDLSCKFNLTKYIIKEIGVLNYAVTLLYVFKNKIICKINDLCKKIMGLKKIRSLRSLYAGKRLTVWGCGALGRKNAKNMSMLGVKFEITDVNAKIHGQRISANAVVKPWNEVKEHTDVVLVSARGVFDQVRNKLAKECPDIEVVDLIALLKQ